MRALLLAVVLPLPAAAARPVTLPEAYALALARSEDLVQAGAQYEEVEARARELIAATMPSISLNGTLQFQDIPPGSSGLFLQRRRDQAWVSARQPIFSGFREILAYRSAKDQGESARLGWERAKQLLYQDTARGYLDLLDARREIAIRRALVDNTEDRVRELKQRLQVGRSRRSELLAAEAQLAQALAQVEQSRAAERVAQSMMRFLTGLDEDLAPAELSDPGPLPPTDAALARASARPDVEAKRREVEAAERNIAVVSRQRWPILFADANYYIKRPPSFTDKVKWDAALTAEIPLFSGGGTGAQVRQRRARLKAGRAALERLERDARRQAGAALEESVALAAVVAALAKADAAAAANAKAQAEDYRLGMVTNLDVLGALNALQEARLRHDQARLDEYWARVRLQVAAGASGGAL